MSKRVHRMPVLQTHSPDAAPLTPTNEPIHLAYHDDSTHDADKHTVHNAVIQRHASEPSPQHRRRRSTPFSYALEGALDLIRQSSDQDQTYVIPDATPQPTSEDVEPVRSLRSNPLWRVVGTALLFLAVAVLSKPVTDDLEADYLPTAIQDARHSLFESISSILQTDDRPGVVAARDGLVAHHPLVFIPGIVTTGLELWQGQECAQGYFRQRVYGSTTMLRSIVTNKACWLHHLKLDNETGLDPPGIKLRSAVGLEAADYLLGNYWVWGRLITNFADIGYDSNSMFMAAYDWRLSFKDGQLRDFNLQKLKSMIELARAANQNRKVSVLAHSMGGNLWTYFAQWVQSKSGADAGTDWIANNIAHVIHIGTPHLGVAKAFSSLHSGEMKDTAELLPLVDYIRQKALISQKETLDMMRTFRSVPSMMMKGMHTVWGSHDDNIAADELARSDNTHLSAMGRGRAGSHDIVKLNRRNPAAACDWCYGSPSNHSAAASDLRKRRGSFLTLQQLDGTSQEMTITDALDLLAAEAPDYWHQIDELYSQGQEYFKPNSFELLHQRYWSNPLQHQLPISENTTYYCLYGSGRETERGYVMVADPSREVPYYINTSHTDEAVHIRRGVKYEHGGDGTVNLLSLGYICQMWKSPTFNPSGSRIITREYRDKHTNKTGVYDALVQGVKTVTRSIDSVDHVDIMGNNAMILDLLRIVGIKHVPSSSDRFCDPDDEPQGDVRTDSPNQTNGTIDRTLDLVSDEEIKSVVDSHNTVHGHAVPVNESTLRDAMSEMRQKQRRSGDSPEVDSLSRLGLSESVPPGACLRKHYSDRQSKEESAGIRQQRQRRYQAVNDSQHAVNPEQAAVDVGSQNSMDSTSSPGTDDKPHHPFHWHYDLYDRYYSCILEMSDNLHPRLGITDIPPINEEELDAESEAAENEKLERQKADKSLGES